MQSSPSKVAKVGCSLSLEFQLQHDPAATLIVAGAAKARATMTLRLSIGVWPTLKGVKPPTVMCRKQSGNANTDWKPAVVEIYSISHRDTTAPVTSPHQDGVSVLVAGQSARRATKARRHSSHTA